MKDDVSAYWVKDGSTATLYAGKKIRAEAYTDFNIATIYTSRGLFRKPEEKPFIVGLDKVIVSEIEKSLGLSALPVFDKNGKALAGVREEMEACARSFDDNRPSDDPVGEAVNRLGNAHYALNVVAREGGLSAPAADARLLCIKARLNLTKERCFSDETVRTINAASLKLTDAAMPRPLMVHAHLTVAGIHCKRAAALASRYGSTAKRQHEAPGAAGQSAAAESPVKAFVATDKVTITKGDPLTEHWLQGYVNKWPEYTFSAKVFDVGSGYGIDGGRISKLTIMRKGDTVMSYDRGWDETPSSWKDKAALKEVLAGFPELSQGHDALAATRRTGARPKRGF